MVPTPVCFTTKTPLSYRFVGFSPKRTSHFIQRTQLSLNPAQIAGFRTGSSSTPFSSSLNYSHGAVFKDLVGGSEIGYRQLGFHQSRVLAVSEGGSGGSGGLGGSSGGGGGSDSGGNSNWSFLSWYLYLSKLISVPGASGAFLRLLVDQFVFSPIFIGVFLSTLVTLEGRPSQVVPKLQQEWFSAVLANWQLWIPFQFLNFSFVPQQFQVLAANVIALVWNVILSFKAHKEVLPK